MNKEIYCFDLFIAGEGTSQEERDPVHLVLERDAQGHLGAVQEQELRGDQQTRRGQGEQTLETSSIISLFFPFSFSPSSLPSSLFLAAKNPLLLTWNLLTTRMDFFFAFLASQTHSLTPTHTHFPPTPPHTNTPNPPVPCGPPPLPPHTHSPRWSSSARPA